MSSFAVPHPPRPVSASASPHAGLSATLPSPSGPSPNLPFQLSLPQHAKPTPSPAPPSTVPPGLRRGSVSDAKPTVPTLNGAGGSNFASGSGHPQRTPGQQPPQPGRPAHGFWSNAVIDGKTKEERIVTEGLRSSVHLALAADQLYATHPDLSSFHSADDVVDRLLPYHIFNIPDEDLVPTTAKGKGKARARDWDVAQLAGEVDETEDEERARLKEVISFAKRKRAIEKRFEKLRTADGQHASPTSQAIYLARASIDEELAVMASHRSKAYRAKQMYDYLNEKLSYQVQGIPWLEHEHPPPGSGPLPPQPSYQQPTPTYTQQPQYANNTRPPPPQPPRVNPPVDLNAPVPLSLPGSTLPRLVALGLIAPAGGSTPAGGNLASGFRVEGSHVCFSITLSQLSQVQMKGLAELLNSVKGAPAAGASAPGR